MIPIEGFYYKELSYIELYGANNKQIVELHIIGI